VLRLKTELAETSSQDEFARWAKVRRTLDRKVVELESLSTSPFPLSPLPFPPSPFPADAGIDASIATHRATFDSRASSVRWLLTTGLRIFLQFWFSKQPIFWLPEGWVPGVVEWGLAFPRAPRGSVSIQVWSFAVGQVVSVLMVVVAWAYAQVVLMRRKKAVPTAAAEKKKV